ncbi:hypothetical protein ACFU7Z_00785 [Kitasatospora sp. NPDC057518]|uniref:hypothetical protein n=1 Tax=Kitasatospora sp. NPDC057518 TaxID=3346155 RepID=UPI0036BB5EF5
MPVPPVGAGAGFAPYVDTSLHPPYDPVATAGATGVKNVALALALGRRGVRQCRPAAAGLHPGPGGVHGLRVVIA